MEILSITEVQTLSLSYVIYVNNEINQVYSYKDVSSNIFFIVNGVDMLEEEKKEGVVSWYQFNLETKILQYEQQSIIKEKTIIFKKKTKK